MIRDVIVIGTGPAGLFAGLNIKNKDILIVEKNKAPGKKLLISGKGQCNYTNSKNIKEFLDHYGENYRFLRYSFNRFSNNDLIDYLNKKGFKSFIREDGKVFPQTLDANDFTDFLYKECLKNNVEFKFNTIVKEIRHDNGVFEIICNNSNYKSKQLVIATGGITYPNTGSTGDGYRFAKMFGHNIIKPEEALTPVNIKDYQFSNLSGISIENTKYSIWRDGKKIKDLIDTLLFTHKGLSGPGIINNSRYMKEGDTIKVSIVQYYNIDIFREDFIKELNNNGKIMIKTFLKRFNIIKRLIDNVLESLDINPETTCAQLAKKDRNKLINYLLEYPFVIESFGGLHIAMVTKGGIDLKEVNPKTMESKLVKGLYFAGEILDIDGDTGGYNIQAAISTSKVLAESINSK